MEPDAFSKQNHHPFSVLPLMLSLVPTPVYVFSCQKKLLLKSSGAMLYSNYPHVGMIMDSFVSDDIWQSVQDSTMSFRVGSINLADVEFPAMLFRISSRQNDCLLACSFDVSIYELCVSPLSRNTDFTGMQIALGHLLRSTVEKGSAEQRIKLLSELRSLSMNSLFGSVSCVTPMSFDYLIRLFRRELAGLLDRHSIQVAWHMPDIIAGFALRPYAFLSVMLMLLFSTLAVSRYRSVSIQCENSVGHVSFFFSCSSVQSSLSAEPFRKGHPFSVDFCLTRYLAEQQGWTLETFSEYERRNPVFTLSIPVSDSDLYLSDDDYEDIAEKFRRIAERFFDTLDDSAD